VLRMMEFLRANMREEIFGAYLHGSLATGEEIPYSDFDALVVHKRDGSRNPTHIADLNGKLKRAQQIMFEFDPLQHHGWFELSESQFSHYNSSVFPYELFAFSKSLLLDQGLDIALHPCDSRAEMRSSFLDVVRNFQHGIQSAQPLKNMYHLKNTLSLFMLLPALYVQARDGRGIFKKLSFAAARTDFSETDWEPMVRVSEIRALWRLEISPLKRWLLTRPWKIRRRCARYLAPAVPFQLRELITAELRGGMFRLAGLMKEKLDLTGC